MIAALAAAIAIASPSPAPSSTPAPQEIFDRTFERLASYPVAPYALMVVKFLGRGAALVPGIDGTDFQYVGRYAFRSSDGAENAALFVPNAKALPDANVYLNQPYGPFVWSIRRANINAPDEPPVPDVPSPLKTIGHVVTYAPPKYAITNAGIETVNGHAAYHLHLNPLSDPRRHNLRELWVDPATFDLWKATFDGTYHPLPGTADGPSTFTSEFKAVGPFWINVHQYWTWTDFQGEHSWNFERDTYVMMFPDAIPDWIFDQNAYDLHRHAGDADVLDAMLRAGHDAR